jgi:hypothetical protein
VAPDAARTECAQAESKPSQIRASSSKARPKWSKEIPWISFAQSSLIKGLRRPLGPFFSFAPFPPQTRRGRRRRCPLAPFVCQFPWSSFRVPLAFSSEVKGWRLLQDRGCLDAISARPDGREASTRKGNPASTGHGLADKDRPVDPMSGKNTPAWKRARSGVEPWQADGRQPFMPLRVSHDPCL